MRAVASIVEMRVSQVAFDRYLVELPPPEPGYVPLGDPVELKSIADWICAYGRMPIVALVARDAWTPAAPHRVLPWVPGDADEGDVTVAWKPEVGSAAVVLNNEEELRDFLSRCAAPSRLALLWPRLDVAKTMMRLSENGDWQPAAEAVARFSRDGARMEVVQLLT